ncbi:trace amine-associated receptor 13c-like [Mugil cephalus]|uniref:trace amine-associated receptor 13c-like n=1 Tax=Mugil cephalus TaxID=48193 RepID=UPI001FB65797|nr:trace amine-associated receptor 13c-like [Mugil cephalus]
MTTFEETELCFPHLLNSSCRKIMHSHSAYVFIYLILSLISLITVTLNLLVIISISHFKQLHTPTNLLLLSLAVSDCFVGLLMLFQIMLIDGCWFLGDLICALYYVFAYIVTSAAVGTMVLISVDRYVAICDPLQYPTKVTQRRVCICVCVCWICSVLFPCQIMKDNVEQPGRYKSCIGECVIVVDNVTAIADLLLSFVGPVTVIIVLYLRVFVVAVSQARAMRSNITALTLQRSGKVTAKKSELKAARTLGVVIVVFLICLCPYYCVTLRGQDALLNTSSITFVICLFYFNSCLNPIIYALFYPWFRKTLKHIVTLQILKPGSSEASIMK